MYGIMIQLLEQVSRSVVTEMDWLNGDLLFLTAK